MAYGGTIFDAQEELLQTAEDTGQIRPSVPNEAGTPQDIVQLSPFVVTPTMDTFQDELLSTGGNNIFDYYTGMIVPAPTQVGFGGGGSLTPQITTQPLQPMPVQGVYEQIYNDELARTNAVRARQGLPPLSNLDSQEISRIADFAVKQVGQVYDDAQRDLDRTQAARQIGGAQMPFPLPLPIPGDLANIINAAELAALISNVAKESNLNVPTPATPQQVVETGNDLSQIGTVPPSPGTTPGVGQAGNAISNAIGSIMGPVAAVGSGIFGGTGATTGGTTQTTTSAPPLVITPGATGGETGTGSSTPSVVNPGGTTTGGETGQTGTSTIIPSTAEQVAKSNQQRDQLLDIMNQSSAARAQTAAAQAASEAQAQQQRQLLEQIMAREEANRRILEKRSVVPTDQQVPDEQKMIVRSEPTGPKIKPEDGRVIDENPPQPNPPVVIPRTTTSTTTTSVNPGGITPFIFNLPTSTYNPMPTTPAQRNIYLEGTTTSSAFTQLTPAFSQMYGGLAKGYQAEDASRLFGMADPNSQFAQAQQGLNYMANLQTQEANRALRMGNMQDVLSMQQQAMEARRAANPELYGALGQLTDQARAQAASDYASMQTAGQLSPEDIRNAQQSAREAYAARGQVMSPGAVGAEILNRQALQQQREQQARSNYQQSLGNLGAATQMQTANIFDPFSTLLGQQYGMQTQNVGTTQGLFGQAGALASGGLSYAPVVQTYNPFGVYPADVYGTNVNAVNAAQIAEANRAAALQAANLGQTGDYAKALGTFLGSPSGGNVLGGLAKFLGIGG